MITGEEMFLEFNNYASPVFVTSADGIIVYKNKIAKYYGNYRKGSSIAKYIHKDEKQEAINCINSSKSGIFRLIDVLGCSYALFVPYSRDNNFCVVVLIPGVALMLGTSKGYEQQNIESTLRCRINTLQEFEKSIKDNAISNTVTQKYEKLLKISNMLLFRSAFHNTVALDRIKTIQSHEKQSTISPVNIFGFIDEIMKICIPYCTSLGFRVKVTNNIDILNVSSYARVNKRDFISIFTSCLTLALRLSSDGKCEYKSFCANDSLFMNFIFKEATQNADNLKFEKSFLRDATLLNNWDFSVLYSGNTGNVSLMIPLCEPNDTTVRQTTGNEYALNAPLVQIVEAELCILDEMLNIEL